MKKLIVFIVMGMFWFSAMAGEEITIPDEVSPTITRAKISQLIILPAQNKAYVTLEKGYIVDGKFISSGKVKKLKWKNSKDNPYTEADETSTAYTDFIRAIGIDKAALKAEVEVRFQQGVD